METPVKSNVKAPFRMDVPLQLRLLHDFCLLVGAAYDLSSRGKDSLTPSSTFQHGAEACVKKGLLTKSKEILIRCRL